MEQDPNYGRTREPGDEIETTTSLPQGEGTASSEDSEDPVPARSTLSGVQLSAEDERTWSILSHVSVLAWPVTGFLPIAPLIVWLLYKDRSPRIGFHALQSMWYQVAWLVLGTIGGFVAVVFTLLTLGFGIFLIAPLAAILGLVPFVHQIYAAYKVSQGIDYRYPFIADKIDGGDRLTL
ncbi:hypothetical protein BH23ACT11_BH23ACT11_24640 [soil metagenome]